MGLFSKIFGGSREKTRSWNNAYEGLNKQLGGSVGAVGDSTNALSALLGLGGDPAAQQAAFNTFKDSTGYNFLLDSGISAIKGGNASRGLFNSGATGKALMEYGTNLADTTYGNYMDRLLGVGKLGLGAAGVLSDAGRESKGKASKDTGNFGEFLGSIFASEPILKTNVTKLGELEDGLGIYSYEYKDDPGFIHIGTMADEVEELRPWALGPRTEEGHRTVDYSKLNSEKE